MQVLPFIRQVLNGDTVAADGVEQRKFQLILRCIQVDQQVINLIQHSVRSGIRAVDLVDHNDNFQTGVQGLVEYEAGLGQRAFTGIHQQNGAVGHGQGAFNLPAEIGMPRGIDDIDAHILPHHRAVLGGNGDSALALEIHGVHQPLVHVLVGAKESALMKHGVHQGGFAMVDMGDDGDVSQRVVDRFCGHPYGSALWQLSRTAM